MIPYGQGWWHHLGTWLTDKLAIQQKLFLQKLRFSCGLILLVFLIAFL